MCTIGESRTVMVRATDPSGDPQADGGRMTNSDTVTSDHHRRDLADPQMSYPKTTCRLR